MSTRGLFANAALIFLGAVMLPATVLSETGSEAEDQIAASVNGQSMTAAQLEAVIKPRVEPVNRQIQQIRESALQKLIDNLILEQPARKA